MTKTITISSSTIVKAFEQPRVKRFLGTFRNTNDDYYYLQWSIGQMSCDVCHIRSLPVSRIALDIADELKTFIIAFDNRSWMNEHILKRLYTYASAEDIIKLIT